jgi:hypothetical protein
MIGHCDCVMEYVVNIRMYTNAVSGSVYYIYNMICIT